MANEKYKFYGLNPDGESTLITTDNHPKLDAGREDLGDALTGLTSLYGNLSPDKIVLTSDTTVYQAE